MIFKSIASFVEPSAGDQVPVRSRSSPVVIPVPEMEAIVPVVAELAVRLKMPVPV